ncbi:MAG TPA: sterol desaturase family protein [Rhizomicrobium sp.]|nr:sterol desaturase family protein [Rhizomicrobium sp.]
MAATPPHPIIQAAADIAAQVLHLLSSIFLSPGSSFSLHSLACAAAIAALFLIARRLAAKRKTPRAAALWRAMFPRWLWAGASTRADIGFFLLNTFATASLIGWGILSAGAISDGTGAVLTSIVGSALTVTVPGFAASIILTAALFVAYDFAYWIDHYLKHKIPVLWEFHRVHHTAEVLSPLTSFRMHPIDSLVFYNIVAIVLGVTHGTGSWTLGDAEPFGLSGNNIILVAFILTTIHLQHSHIDIRFTGRLGKLILSPAHHQIHHSIDSAHFDSNLGSCLAVWDWMFGTLMLPDEIDGKLTFGADVEDDRYAPHTMAGSLAWPFVRAVRRLMPRKASSTQIYDALG